MAKRGRKPLEGGRKNVEVPFGRTLLERVTNEAAKQGASRAAYIREACERALAARMRVGGETDLSQTTGPLVARGAAAMAHGVYAGWYPSDLDDEFIVRDLRQMCPGGVIVLRRSPNPIPPVFAKITPENVYRAKGGTGTPPRFHRVIFPSEPAVPTVTSPTTTPSPVPTPTTAEAPSPTTTPSPVPTSTPTVAPSPTTTPSPVPTSTLATTTRPKARRPSSTKARSRFAEAARQGAASASGELATLASMFAAPPKPESVERQLRTLSKVSDSTWTRDEASGAWVSEPYRVWEEDGKVWCEHAEGVRRSGSSYSVAFLAVQSARIPRR
jgi:hypothetical protein